MRKHLFITVGWICSLSLFVWVATNGDIAVAYSSAQATAREQYRQQWLASGLATFPLQEGDLIVRAGRSFFSNELRKFSRRDPTYSHCGWIVQEDGRWVVYHAIGGTDNPDNRLRRDGLFSFCHPLDVTQFAVYRYKLPAEEIHKATRKARELHQAEVSFDLQFTLDDNHELYCAEFIWEILKETENQAEFISLSRLDNKLYIGVDDLYLHNYCEKIFQYAYR